MKIITHFDFPPIPDRNFDWSAITDNYEPGEYDYDSGRYHGGHPMGHGRTELAAVRDLVDRLEEREESA